SGDRVDLANELGEVIFTFRFSDARPWTNVPDGTGHSLVLAKLGGDPEEASTWAPSTYIGGSPGEPDPVLDPGGGGGDPTLVTLIDIGHAGRYFKGTEEPSPGGNTLDWTQITFDDNPWLEGPSGYGYSNEGVETQYISTTLGDMNGGYISVYARLSFTLTQEQIDSFTELQAEVHYDDDYILFLNGTYVGKSGQIAAPPVAFNWGRGSGSDYSTAYHNLTGSLNLLEVGENILAIQIHNGTISGSSDGYGAAVLKAVEEDPGNTVDPHARLVINEVFANSDALPATDWIELYNPGPGAMDMSNIYLSDDRFNLLMYKISDVTPLQPGELRVIEQGTPPAGFPFAIEYEGEKIYLTMASDDPSPVAIRVLDVSRHGALEPEMSFGRYPDGSDYLGILSSATKGASNTSLRVHDIVINEIMYHHGNRDERYEYVELYNRGAGTVSLAGWAFTDGIEYTFPAGIEMAPDSYLVVAKNPTLLNAVYPPGNNLQLGVNLLGPYAKELGNHTERIQLSYPFTDPDTQLVEMAVADEVTYYDGGRWPTWADGEGSSMELIDPDSDNDTPDAWADSNEIGKSTWQEIDFTIQSNDSNYTHDTINVFAMMLLNRGEVLVDDIQLIRNDDTQNPLIDNSGFETDLSDWNLRWESGYGLDLGGNHIRSFVTTDPAHVHSGSRALHIVATGHGDPGANRINQVISGSGGKLHFKGWARWLRGSRYLLLRTSNDNSPVQPPRPAYVKELNMPANLGTPGLANSMLETNRGPDIRETIHSPVLPTANEQIVVTTRVTDNDGVSSVTLYYRTERSGGGGSFTSTSMLDNGSGNDMINGDGIYTGVIPGEAGNKTRAFYIAASDGSASTRFPTELELEPFAHDTYDISQRTCLVRIGDRPGSAVFDTYRVWFSDDVISEFTSRPNLSNELMDCTFVFNDTEVFYNVHIRWRGSPFLRGGQTWNPATTNKGFRIEFNPDQKFGSRDEINLDNTESESRGPLQERASYWFYRKMGLQFSNQKYIRPIFNGNMYYRPYTDVQKIDGDYIDAWFPDDNDGYIHKIDDYFEYNVQGTSHSNLDEGLKSDASHPAIPETYRWGFEKRSHRENDEWSHLFGFAYAMNTSTSNPAQYEAAIESKIDPLRFASVLAIRHACGDWDSYGYNRGKNNFFYYAPMAAKWHLLPWDIDFTLGSGHSATTDIFSVNSGQFPEVKAFLDYPKYHAMYLQALEEMVYGPWQTSYGTANPPTPFDIFVEEQNRALKADGYNQDSRLYS
ncbi:MAG: lamin tail domain-containing protein, partial [Planctomycetes bacterium]|nr:lamin tail domain-containing protein [Planctomycetota bacterium]